MYAFTIIITVLLSQGHQMTSVSHSQPVFTSGDTCILKAARVLNNARAHLKPGLHAKFFAACSKHSNYDI